MSVKETERLLRDCSIGLKMGISAIDETIQSVKSENLKDVLKERKNDHVKLSDTADDLLSGITAQPAEPGAAAKGMSWFKTNLMLTMSPEDSTVAELITDGCSMGVKSINKALNENKSADASAKDIAKRLIQLDKKLALDVSAYL